MSFMYRIIIFIIYMFFASCVAVSTFEIQVLEPATDPVTPDIENVVILNRTIIGEPDFSETGNSGPVETGNRLTDRATTEIVFALADILNESPGIGYIDTVNILESPDFKENAIPVTLNSEFIKNLCDSMNVNAVFSLDIFIVEIPDSILVTGESQGTYPGLLTGRIDVPVSAFWRIYRMPEGILADEYAWFDTMSWQHSSYNTIEIADKLPSIETIKMEAAYFSALSFARRVSPYWATEERNLFFRGNMVLRNAANMFFREEFEAAEQQYEKLVDRRNRNVAAAAAFNLALIYEIRGDYRLAYNWAVRSYQFRNHPVIIEYINILEERLGKSRLLDRQLGIKP
jgi:hypothetical protein